MVSQVPQYCEVSSLLRGTPRAILVGRTAARRVKNMVVVMMFSTKQRLSEFRSQGEGGVKVKTDIKDCKAISKE